MSPYLQIIRPKNLMIVALSQVMIYVLYFMPILSENGVVLERGLWWLFIIDTVLIAASGYVINDIFDLQTDTINKPDKTFIGDQKIAVSKAKILYGVILALGLAIAAYIALEIDKLHLLSIYPLACGMLYMYSYKWKQEPWIGNLVVATFCAFVPGILWYAELDRLSVLAVSNPIFHAKLWHLFLGYIVFAFLSTLFRELIKDIEDVEGDTKASYRTASVVYGMKFCRNVATGVGVLLLFSYSIWWSVFSFPKDIVMGLCMLILLVLPTLIILFKLYFSNTKADFSTLSKLLKILMIVALFVFLCIPFCTSFMHGL